MSFTDDLVVCSDSYRDHCDAMEIVKEFSEVTGLKVNTSKSAAFTIVPVGKTWILANTVYDLGGPVPVISSSSTTKYLGGLISPWKGIVVDRDPWTALNTYCEAIGKYPLKPHQLVKLTKEYVVHTSMISWQQS